MNRKVLCLALTLFLMISLFIPNNAAAETSDLPDYEKAAENDQYAMYFNKDLADVAIVDKASHQVWRTIPEEWEKDFSNGIPKMNMASQLILQVYDDQDRETTYNSYTMSVKKKTVDYQKIDGGLRINYLFEKQEIKISLEFTLNQDGFTVRIPSDSIDDSGTYRIQHLRLLPYFGASQKGDEGYILIPDGSGTLIDFSDNQGNYNELSRPVYSFNRGVARFEQPPREESFRLPVFGMKQNSSAFLAVIESGDYSANINAGVAGNLTGYYRVYPSFIYRDIHRSVLFEGQAYTNETPDQITERLVVQLSPNQITEDMTIRYHLLNGENANYSGMAAVYQNYLVKEKEMVKRLKDEIPLNVTLLGGLRMRKVILGLPFTVMEPLTTFKQAVEILKELKDKGVNDLNVTYAGYNGGGYRYRITDKIRAAWKLGGSGGLKKLVSYTAQEGINFMLDGEFLNVYNEGNGFKSNRDAVRYLSNAIAFNWTWNIISGKKLDGGQRAFLLSPSKLFQVVDGFTASLQKYNIKSIAFEYLGDIVYSQSKKTDMLNQDQVGGIWEKTLDKAASTMERVMVKGGNAYSFPYASYITEAPLTGSGFDMATESVPFYEMVIHGYIAYSGKPSNRRYNDQDEFLRMIECGALPYYEWMYRESSLLKSSIYNELKSGCYQDWLEEAVDEYKQVQELYKDVYDKRILSHQKLQEGVYRTTYENETSIYVNYNNKSVTAEGIDIPAKGYAIKGGTK